MPLLVRLSLLILVSFYSMQGISKAASACTHYASPTGSASGVSASQPFSIADFWRRAKPGYTLCLLDGKYTGVASMINPPRNLNGTPGMPITIRALNDGKVSINGESVNQPVHLRQNDYFVLEGFNAHHSKNTVIELSRSNHNIVRRVAAWDAADNNTEIFGAHHGRHNLFEDVAGWGIARKIFQFSYGGDYTTVRRAWGRWEGSHVVGPKMTYTLAYNNYNMICENCIGTWSGERLKPSYNLMDYYGKPWTGKGAGSYTNHSVDQPYGIFGIDGLSGDKDARTKLLGSIAYVRGTDRFPASQTVFITKLDSVEVANTVAFIEPGTHTSKKPFSLNNLSYAPGLNLIATSLIGIGGARSTFGSDWKTTSIIEGASLRSVGNVYNKAGSANICYRYKDGALTTDPLWPWPMNQRIKEAMVESGRNTVDLTATVEGMFGTIPSSCKTTGVE
jgi:hypothetical protein